MPAGKLKFAYLFLEACCGYTTSKVATDLLSQQGAGGFPYESYAACFGVVWRRARVKGASVGLL